MKRGDRRRDNADLGGDFSCCCALPWLTFFGGLLISDWDSTINSFWSVNDSFLLLTVIEEAGADKVNVDVSAGELGCKPPTKKQCRRLEIY